MIFSGYNIEDYRDICYIIYLWIDIKKIML